MAALASPLMYGTALPYPSLFAIPRRPRKLQKRRPPSHFYAQATDPDPAASRRWATRRAELDDAEAGVSDSEDEEHEIPGPAPAQAAEKQAKKKKGLFSRVRTLAFRTKGGKTATTTEFASRQDIGGGAGKPSTGVLFQSAKIKAKGAKAEVKRLAVIVKKRIGRNSPEADKPKTWEEYNKLYAAGAINVVDPPLPPTDRSEDPDHPTAYHSRFYMPPRPTTERARQLIVNRLGLYGPPPPSPPSTTARSSPRHPYAGSGSSSFDASEEGDARAKARTELGDRLEAEGSAPTDLVQPFGLSTTTTTTTTDEGGGREPGVQETRDMIEGVRSGALPPDTLEQHPVFRRIVKQCREMFGTSISMLTVMDEDRQIFLAESGLGGMRDVPRDITFCAHTILAGRQGFVTLDSHNDWRFENGPLVQKYGSRFYAGVPLMAPNLSGDPDEDAASMPLGTLCIIDQNPRQSFGLEERRRLVYFAEAARREIEKWYLARMERKMQALDESAELFRTESASSLESSAPSTTTTERAAVARELGAAAAGQAVASEQASRVEAVASKVDGAGPSPPSKTSRSRSFASLVPSRSKPNLHHQNGTAKPTPTGANVAREKVDLFGGEVPARLQKVCDLATKLVGDTLDLDLAYLVAVRPDEESGAVVAGGGGRGGETKLVSAHNLPSPVPVFDAPLHLRALRAPEKGLLYQNPTVQEAGAGLPSASKGQDKSPYASAVLLPVGEERKDGHGKPMGGFVLAGFTADRRRVFGGEDVAYLRQFAKELERYVANVDLA